MMGKLDRSWNLFKRSVGVLFDNKKLLLFTGLVGLLIRTLEERIGLLGRWIIKLIGLAWSVASVFVVPIIVLGQEGTSPLRMLKTSAGTLKKTWGESLLGCMGVQFGGLVMGGCVAVYCLCRVIAEE
ncbi:MAG TPA: DUF6159 family protein [Candidatus Brocadiia bacterium]|nr:DUF6159 family protein [Candidatus Brocadiia bacterium]